MYTKIQVVFDAAEPGNEFCVSCPPRSALVLN